MADQQHLLDRIDSLLGAEFVVHKNLELALVSGDAPPPPSSTSDVAPMKVTPKPLVEALKAGNWIASHNASQLILVNLKTDFDAVPIGLPYHQLQPADAAFALGAGVLSALMPSIRINDNQTSNLASWLHENQDGKLRTGLESILGPSESLAIDNVFGGLHRFTRDQSGILQHDALHQFLSAIGNPALGLPHLKRALSHLVVDAFGATGIPLPVTNYALNTADFFDLPTPNAKELSRLAAFRHADWMSSGTTSMLLFAYEVFRDVPSDSFRRYKIAILAHYACAMTVFAVAPFFPRLAARRSQVNYVSATLFLKNCSQLVMAASALRAETEKISNDIDLILSGLLKAYELEESSRG